MNKIIFFFRKTLPGAYSINQIFNAIAAEIGKTLDVHIYELNNAGANPQNIAANIVETNRTAREGIHHITGDVHYIALGLRKRYIVLTIHDCVMLSLTSRWHPKFYAYLWLWYKLPLRMANAVTTISPKSKDEIVAFTGCPPDKIKVIPNFVHEAYRFHPRIFDKIRPRILHIGISPNKNLERVVAALEGIPCVFEIIGELKDDDRKLLNHHRVDFENRINLTLEAMAERYRQADMLVFASTYEGFGLPIVEAQATGRPVVTSNLEPMTWVAGMQSASFVDPFDSGSIRMGILRVIKDDGFREQIIQNGLENVRRFTLKQVARQYMEIYESLSDPSCAA